MEFMFGELLAFAISMVALIYLSTRWDHIRGLPGHPWFVLAIGLLTIALACSIAEEFPGGAEDARLALVGSEVGPATGDTPALVLNLVEHAGFALSALALLVGLIVTRGASTE